MDIASIARRVSCAAVMLSIAVSAAYAQSPGTRVPVANKQVVSANPFLLMAEWANVEYERKASERFTFGGSLSSVGLDDANYRNFQGWLFGAKRNFALSLGAGATRLFGGDLDEGSVLIPTARLVNIGWSF